MLTFTIHSFDVVTGRYLGEVPMLSWTHEDRLNDSGAWSAVMAPPLDADHARFLIGATEAVKTFLVAVSVDEEGITRVEYTGWIPPGGARRPQLAGGSMLSYYDRRVFTLDAPYSVVAQEQVDITATILAAANPSSMTYATTATGVLRDASWTPGDAKPVGEILREIPARINGFDWSLGYELDAGVFVQRYRTFYPRRGGGVTPVFSYGGNMKTLPQPDGNPGFADRIVAVGAQTDAEANLRLVEVYTNSALIDAGYPIVDIRLDRNDIITAGALGDTAEGAGYEAGQARDGELIFEIDTADLGWRWGKWDLGADCVVEVPSGVDLWRPDGLQETRRILAHRATVAGQSSRMEVVAGRQWVAST